MRLAAGSRFSVTKIQRQMTEGQTADKSPIYIKPKITKKNPNFLQLSVGSRYISLFFLKHIFKKNSSLKSRSG
jgi:hypothetical protein